MGSGQALLESVRAALAAAGDPRRAVEQQAYMRSSMPFHGVGRSEVRRIARQVLARPDGPESWERDVRVLWSGATHREERYVAIDLARHPAAREWQRPGVLPLYHHMSVTGAWWDVVDEIAARLVGEVLARHREAATPVLRTWAREDDQWVRRTAVLAQLRHGEATDLDLLADVIAVNAEDPSFWLRKAIGWALRQQARVDPVWVRSEVSRLGPSLSPLSRREALKHLHGAVASLGEES